VATKLIQISPEVVLNTAIKVEKDRSEFRTGYMSIYRAVNSLEADWTGDASAEFSRRINAYRNDFVFLDNYLCKLTDYLTKVSRTYQDLERDLATEALRLPDLS